MNPMEFARLGGDELVYVREVKRAELPPDVVLAPGVEKVYAIHDAAGHRLALTDDRKAAFFMARRHDRMPVSVH